MVAFFKSHQALEHIKLYVPGAPIIVEAGAFDGRDTQRLAAMWPKSTIYAFEPVPELFALLKKNTAHLTNVYCYELALSNQEGTATFYVSEKPNKPGKSSQAGSLLKPKERLSWSPIQFPRTITVPTITLDLWAQREKVDKIDLLWLDMQGPELTVLQASPHIVNQVSVIYTEVGFIEAYEKQPLYGAVKEWLAAHNFREVGRTFENEHQWFFGNIVMVKNKEHTILFT